jgi:plasmid stability protein
LDYYRVNIPDDSVNEALREAAEAHGRSVEDEIREIVMNNAPAMRKKREYPPGCEPLPGESFVDHIVRISRPGFEIDIERDRTPHTGLEL